MRARVVVRTRVDTAPEAGPILARQLWHLDRATRLRILDDLNAAEDAGAGIDVDGDGPVFYEVDVAFLGAPASLGALCAASAGRSGPGRCGSRRWSSRGLSTAITTGAMAAGNFDQALGYLLRWVGIETED